MSMDSDDGELAFQDFSHSRGAGRDSLGDLSPPIGADGDAASFGGGHVTLDDEPLDAAPNVGANGAIGDQQYSIFNVRYYARFFNVDTPDVASRIAFASLPLSDKFFEKLQRNPDLYGPVWISSTVVFLLAATGNFASYIEFASARGMQAASYSWQFDFTKMTLGATLIYGYAFLVPLLVYAGLRYAGSRVGLTDTVCMYGYSLFIYIPASIVCILPQPVVQWIAVGLAATASTVFVVRSLNRALQNGDEASQRYSKLLLGGVAFLSLALAATLKLFLFQNADLSALIADSDKLGNLGLVQPSSMSAAAATMPPEPAMPNAGVSGGPSSAAALVDAMLESKMPVAASQSRQVANKADKKPAEDEETKGEEEAAAAARATTVSSLPESTTATLDAKASKEASKAAKKASKAAAEAARGN